MTPPTFRNIEVELVSRNMSTLSIPMYHLIRPKSSLRSWANLVEGQVLQSKDNTPKLHCIELLRRSPSGPDPAKFLLALGYITFEPEKKKPHIDVKKHNEIINIQNFQKPREAFAAIEKMTKNDNCQINCLSHVNDHMIMGGWGYHAMGLCRLLCLWNRDTTIGAKMWSCRSARKPWLKVRSKENQTTQVEDGWRVINCWCFWRVFRRGLVDP